jgi:PAS domain-containing protein
MSDAALSVLDIGGKVVTWNSGAQRLYEYTSAEATGQRASFCYSS